MKRTRCALEFSVAFVTTFVAARCLTACGNGDDNSSLPPSPAGSADAATDAGGMPATDGSTSTGEAGVASGTFSLDADSQDADATPAGPDPCADAGVPPSTLECAGLYADFDSGTLSPNAEAYAPAVPLWSDGATKERWIELPPGQKIDVTDPNEWVFPVGTKVFKQFTYEGVRVETRLFQKVAPNFWVHATYEWNAAQTATAISYGDTVTVDSDGGTWIIPTPDDCDSCHRGRRDRILGFEQVSLGLAGATGLTLLELAVQDLVSPPITEVNLRIGDDGTGLDAPALSWLHINCGVTCHNGNENADGYGANMRLRLDPTTLDGSPVTSSWDPFATTINVPCVSGSVQGIPRILPGDSAGSAIFQLIDQRGALQMPPIASRVVDGTDVAAVADWIDHMPGADGGTHGGPDGGHPDSGTLRPRDGGGTDATLVEDAGEDAPEPIGSDATVSAEAGEVGGDDDASVGNGGDGGAEVDAESDAEDDAEPDL